MDVSYNPHAERARRKNRSSTNINHLSLAPLTSKLPLNDDDTMFDTNIPLPRPTTSYIQGKSAPTTPRLLTSSATNPPRSRSRSHHRTPSAPGASITTSKSSSHLGSSHGRKAASGTTTPRRRHHQQHELEKPDGDWLLRTGAFMAFEAREYKGQAWLVSRQSSTSLAGIRDAEEEAFEHELAREREINSRLPSRRGSLNVVDDDLSAHGSRVNSRFQSRSHSIAESRSQVLTPLGRVEEGDSYFPSHEFMTGPDFVDLDEKLEELGRDTAEDDEADVKRLMRRTAPAKGSWISSVIGWNLFAVDEHEESDEESEDEESLDGHSQPDRGAWLKHHAEGPLDPAEFVPPPTGNEGGWSDAAWLLSVATKVIF